MISTVSKLKTLTANWRQVGYELAESGNKAVLYYKNKEVASFNLVDVLYKNGAEIIVQDACKNHWDSMLKVFTM